MPLEEALTAASDGIEAGPTGRASGDRRTQTVGLCVAAEARRILRDRRMYLALAIPIALASATVLGVVRVMVSQNMAPDVAGSVPLAMSIGGLVMALILGVGLLSMVSREMADGTVTTAVRFVPDRLRLLVARSASYVAVSTAGALMWLIGVAIVILSVLHGPPGLARSLALIALAGTVATALAVLMMVSLVTALPNGAVALALLLVLNLVLPLGVALLNQLTSGSLTRLVDVVSRILPGSLLMQAMDPVSGTFATVVGGLAGLIIWCAGFFVAAYMRMRVIQ